MYLTACQGRFSKIRKLTSERAAQRTLIERATRQKVGEKQKAVRTGLSAPYPSAHIPVPTAKCVNGKIFCVYYEEYLEATAMCAPLPSQFIKAGIRLIPPIASPCLIGHHVSILTN